MRFVSLLVLLVATVASVPAQTLGRPPADGPSVSLDVLLAVGDDLEVTTTNAQGDLDQFPVEATSMVAALSARVPFGARWTAVAEIPFAYNRFRADWLDGDRQSSDVRPGNPYLGVEARLGSDVVAEGGVRLPLAQRPTFDPDADFLLADGAFAGIQTDIERYEAYVYDVAALAAAIRYTPRLTSALGLRLRLAPTLLIDTEIARNDQTDLALGYGLSLDAVRGRLAVSAGATGRQYLSGSSGDGYGIFAADLAAVIAASVEVGGVRPGVVARVPLTDDLFGVDATVGLSLDVPIR